MTKKGKNKKVKLEKYRSEEQIEIIRFIRILIVVIILIIGIYLFTRLFVTKDLLNNSTNESEINEGSINYNVTNIGSLLNKPENEYYVMIYNTENLRSVYYSGLLTNYERNEDALKVYFADLNKELNKKFYDSENASKEFINISDFKVGDLTLIKIKNGKVDRILTNEEEISIELKYDSKEDTES